jgi:hypothetical protein
MNPVRLSIAQVHGQARFEALAKVKGLALSGLYFPTETSGAEAAEIDIYAGPPGPSLSAWRVGRPSLPPGFLEALLHFLTERLEALHSAGVGHFNLRPESIFLEGSDENPIFHLGGWDCATLMRQKDLVAIPVDPYYAPPEAAGLSRHNPGELLACWDWWGLGRVLQEMLLGHTVLEKVLGRSIDSAARPLLKNKAEELLRGQIAGFKAGALEVPHGSDKRIVSLLRGLLSSGRDSRWRAYECSLWFAGNSPREHYSISGKEPCFRHENQAYTVAEAAEMFRNENNWEQAAAQLLSPDTPDTLAWFILKNSPEAACRQFKAVTALLEDEDLSEFPPAALHEIITMIALLQFTGGKLVWRGRPVDASSLRDFIGREDGSGLWLGAVWALSSTPVLCLLDKLDAESGRIVTDLCRLAGKVVEKAVLNDWITSNDLIAISKLWALSCEHPSVLHQVGENLRRSYACSTQDAVETLFTARPPTTESSILLSFMSEEPERFGFLTHEAWAKSRYRLIFGNGFISAQVLLWISLRKSLRIGPSWFGKLWVPVLAWGLVALSFAASHPGPLMALLALTPLLLVLLVRYVLKSYVNRILVRWNPALAPWKLFDGVMRCQKEEDAFALGHRSRGQLLADIAQANASIRSLGSINPRPALVPTPPSFFLIKLGSLTSWLLFLCLAFFCSWQLKISPPSWEKTRTAWGLNRIQNEAAAGRQVKMPWPFNTPTKVKTIKEKSKRSASQSETEQALANGRAMVSEYETDTISALILVRVPTDDLFGFVLYDGKRHQLASKNVYLLVYNPLPRAWVEIDGKSAFILPQ